MHLTVILAFEKVVQKHAVNNTAAHIIFLVILVKLIKELGGVWKKFTSRWFSSWKSISVKTANAYQFQALTTYILS